MIGMKIFQTSRNSVLVRQNILEKVGHRQAAKYGIYLITGHTLKTKTKIKKRNSVKNSKRWLGASDTPEAVRDPKTNDELMNDVHWTRNNESTFIELVIVTVRLFASP